MDSPVCKIENGKPKHSVSKVAISLCGDSRECPYKTELVVKDCKLILCLYNFRRPLSYTQKSKM